MKILKTIFFWIWKIVSYILILLWKIISSLLISLWMIIKWIMYYIRLDSNTPRTASGSRDRRFKSTRELEYIEKGGGCGYVCGVFFILVMLLGLIVHLFSDGKENDTNKKHTNTEKKRLHLPHLSFNKIRMKIVLLIRQSYSIPPLWKNMR